MVQIKENPTQEEMRRCYTFLKDRFPGGLLGSENAVPFELGNNKNLRINIFPLEDGVVSFGIFLPEAKYSRKTLKISDDGTIEEDKVGIIPDLDLTTSEPDFRLFTNEEIVEAVCNCLRNPRTESSSDLVREKISPVVHNEIGRVGIEGVGQVIVSAAEDTKWKAGSEDKKSLKLMELQRRREADEIEKEDFNFVQWYINHPNQPLGRSDLGRYALVLSRDEFEQLGVLEIKLPSGKPFLLDFDDVQDGIVYLPEDLG